MWGGHEAVDGGGLAACTGTAEGAGEVDSWRWRRREGCPQPERGGHDLHVDLGRLAGIGVPGEVEAEEVVEVDEPGAA